MCYLTNLEVHNSLFRAELNYSNDLILAQTVTYHPCLDQTTRPVRYSTGVGRFRNDLALSGPSDPLFFFFSLFLNFDDILSSNLVTPHNFFYCTLELSVYY